MYKDEKYNILYIDDEKLNLLAVRALLREDFNFYIAQSIDEAFNVLDNNKIQVVLADQKMPEISGIDFLKKVKKKYPGILRIILTGLIDDTDILDAIDNGNIDLYVTKPFNENELVNTIKKRIKENK